MKSNRTFGLLIIVLTAVILMACSAGGQQSVDLAGTGWQLVAIDGEPVRDDIEVTLVFEAEGQVVGSGGCNSYGGSYEADDSSITFSEVVSTMMACQDQAIMDVESAFLDALNAGGTLDRQGSALTYSTSNGTTLQFAAR